MAVISRSEKSKRLSSFRGALNVLVARHWTYINAIRAIEMKEEEKEKSFLSAFVCSSRYLTHT